MLTDVIAPSTLPRGRQGHGPGPERHGSILISPERLCAAVAQVADAIMVTDLDGTITFVNPACESMTGYTARELLGSNPRILSSGIHPPRFYRSLYRTLARGLPWAGEIVNRRSDGGLYVEERTITPVRDTLGVIDGYVAVGRDVTTRRELGRSLPSSVPDQDAIVNTAAALQAGDSVEETSARIADALRTFPDVDTSTVLLADEDGLWVAGIATEPDLAPRYAVGDRVAQERALQLLDRAASGPWVEAWGPGRPEDEARVEVSGVAATLYVPIRNGGSRPLGLLVAGSRRSDETGRLAGRIPGILEIAVVARTLLQPALHERVTRRADRLRIVEAIERMEFDPVFQPIVELSTGAAVGFEALTRFRDGTPVTTWFADARRAGLGTALEVATAVAAVHAARTLPTGTWLSLNVSPALAMHHASLAGVLEQRDRPVVLELTEHEAVSDYAAIRDVLRSFGPEVGLAVDDAGAGVANLVHLVELRPDMVKMDLSLVRGIDADVTRQALAAGLVHFGQTSGQLLVAEGVETVAERDTLLRLGVRLGQGYLLGHPLTVAAHRLHPTVVGTARLPTRRWSAQRAVPVRPPAPSTAPGLELPSRMRRRVTLSARDVELMRYLVTGSSLAEAAAMLGVATGTAKNRRHEVYQKLGVTSLASASDRLEALGLMPDRRSG